jgi:hypothetical protein
MVTKETRNLLTKKEEEQGKGNNLPSRGRKGEKISLFISGTIMLWMATHRNFFESFSFGRDNVPPNKSAWEG